MKSLPFFTLLLSTLLFAQPDTEVFVMDLHRTDTTFQVSNFRNISNNPGYDSQPFFSSNDKLLYAGTQGGQTEILEYDLTTQTAQRINKPSTGGEYSPQLMPDGKRIAAVRLDTTGLQRLYAYNAYDTRETSSEMLFKELEVAYYAFYDAEWVVASILAGGQLDLVIANIPKDEAGVYVENAGRSIHKVPNTSTVSYTVLNEDKNHDVYVVDVAKAEDTFFVCTLPIGIQDHTWIDSTTLLLGSGSKLYLYDLYGSGEWAEVADLSAYNIENITRIAVSPDTKKISLVAEAKTTTAGAIVDKHIDPFNQGELDNFANAFAENAVIRRFPADTMYVGRDQLKTNYARFFKNNKSWHVTVKNRIVISSYVIDEEEAIVNGKPNRQITLYETKDGHIQSMTFIGDKKSESPLQLYYNKWKLTISVI